MRIEMASRGICGLVMLLLFCVFLCLGSAHRLLLEPHEHNLAPSFGRGPSTGKHIHDHEQSSAPSPLSPASSPGKHIQEPSSPPSRPSPGSSPNRHRHEHSLAPSPSPGSSSPTKHIHGHGQSLAPAVAAAPSPSKHNMREKPVNKPWPDPPEHWRPDRSGGGGSRDDLIFVEDKGHGTMPYQLDGVYEEPPPGATDHVED